MSKRDKPKGTMEDASDDQMKVVERLREELKDKFDLFPDLKTTWNLLRFCRARDFHYEKVKLMLENFVKFRIEVDYETVKQNEVDDFKPLTDNYARGYVGYDYEGRLVMVEKVSESKPQNIVGNVTEKQITNYFVQLYERLLYVVFPVLSGIHKKRIDRTVLVIDLGDINLLKMFDSNLKSFLKFSSKMSQDYYPELLGKSFVINAPWVFKGVWSIVKIWLDKKTTDKFVIESGNGRKQLAECMDIRILPTYLGGEQTGPLTDFTGPWKDDLVDSWNRKSFYLKDRSTEYEYFYTKSEQDRVLSQSKHENSLKSFNKSEMETMNEDDSVVQQVKISSFRVVKLKN